MRILLSNDDGISAPALAALYAVLADFGQVTVVAPQEAQSGAAHAITLGHLSVRRLRAGRGRPFDAICVAGRPADCVRLAILEVLTEPPDLVVSGINSDINVGAHVSYSGTVAAAAEGAMLGVPAVAFSAAADGDDMDLPRVAQLCRKVLQQLLEGGLSPGDLINVNIPLLGRESPRGVKIVRQSNAELRDTYELQRGRPGETYQVAGGAFGPAGSDTDIAAVAAGYVTVTPLRLDRTDYNKLEQLRRHCWDAIAGTS